MLYMRSNIGSIITLLIAVLTALNGCQASNITSSTNVYASKLYHTESYNEVGSTCAGFLNNADIVALFNAVVSAACFGTECQTTKQCAWGICIQITGIANSGEAEDMQDLINAARQIYQGSRKTGSMKAECCNTKGICNPQTLNTIQYVSKIDLVQHYNTAGGKQSGQISVYTYESGGDSLCSAITALLQTGLSFVSEAQEILGVVSFICSAAGTLGTELGLPGVNATIVGQNTTLAGQ